MLFKLKVWAVLKDEKCLIAAMPTVASYTPLPTRKQAQIQPPRETEMKYSTILRVASLHKIKNAVFYKADLDQGFIWTKDLFGPSIYSK